MSFVLRIFSCLILLAYMAAGQFLSSFFLFKSDSLSSCKICTETPIGDIPHSDESSEDMRCESQETEEESKKISLSTESSCFYFSLCSETHYNFQQIVFFSPYRNIFSPPPEDFLS